MNKFIR